jgi:hypothetical protein
LYEVDELVRGQPSSEEPRDDLVSHRLALPLEGAKKADDRPDASVRRTRTAETGGDRDQLPPELGIGELVLPIEAAQSAHELGVDWSAARHAPMVDSDCTRTVTKASRNSGSWK